MTNPNLDLVRTQRVARRSPHWPTANHPDRPRYPSDISDQQWAGLASLVEHPPGVGRPRQYETRQIVDALNYRWETGCSWRMLPHDFPPWPTVYGHFRNWQRRGVLRRIREVLLLKPRPQAAAGGQTPQGCPG